MQADAAHPERGRFVRDQVSALRSIDGLDVELYEFPPGAPQLARAALSARRRPAGAGRGTAGAPRGGVRSGFDVVHAHFGLSAWPALAVGYTSVSAFIAVFKKEFGETPGRYAAS